MLRYNLLSRLLLILFWPVILIVPHSTSEARLSVSKLPVYQTPIPNSVLNPAILHASEPGQLHSIDLWVDTVYGRDSNSGMSATAALKTIQKAADLAGPGTTVHILPGIYREAVRPATSGQHGNPIRYLAEDGPGTAIIRGSEKSSALTWTRLTANTIGLPDGVPPDNIYYTDLSAWGLSTAPRFVVQLDEGGQNVAARLPLAREPDWQVATEWKHHEFWWAADGGWDAAGCNPHTHPKCDFGWRSTTQLTDRTHDSTPAGIEAGNLSTLANLAGGTVVALDNQSGHYVFRRTITAHDRAAGRITVTPPASIESTHQLGWGSKYYVENRPSLLDQPGEWWYDSSAGRLYLWSPTGNTPAGLNIEISRQTIGFDLSNRSYITLDGLNFEFFNTNVIQIGNGNNDKSYHNAVYNATIRYANRGLVIDQGAGGDSHNITDGFTLADSEITYTDSQALLLNYWWDNGNSINTFTHAGIVNTVIRNNNLHHLGFRASSDVPTGATFYHADKLHFEGNHVHHIAHNGMQFSYTLAYSPDQAKIGDILIKDNIFEKACQLATDCGALKFWGDPPEKNIYRDVLITGNIFRNTFGWTYISETRKLWAVDNVWGQGGFGFYTDWVSGLHVYRNIAYNNGFAGFNLYGDWRDADMFYMNNITANSLHGFYLGGLSDSPWPASQTTLKNNIIINNRAWGITIDDPRNLLPSISTINIDYNLYYNNGWDTGLGNPGAIGIYRGGVPNSYYQTLADIQANTTWEEHGVSGNPHFWNYDPDDHSPHDDSWPDFHPTSSSSNLINQGLALPTTLVALLNHFAADDFQQGITFDIGRYEAGFIIKATPTLGIANPGAAVTYKLCLFPPDLPYPVTLNTITPPTPQVNLQLGQHTLNQADCSPLAVTNSHQISDIPPDIWYPLIVNGSGGEFEQTATLNLLIGGFRVYVPVILKKNVSQ